MTSGIDRASLIGVLTLAVTALFIVSGRVDARYRRPLRAAALAAYAVAVALALFATWRWLGR
jgi:hypothetical protein